MRALAKNPEERFSDCEAMSRALAADMPIAVPVEATVQRSAFYQRAATPAGGPSPGDVRGRKRRAFQRRLLAGTAAVIAVATGLAIWHADDKGDAQAEPPVTQTETTATRRAGFSPPAGEGRLKPALRDPPSPDPGRKEQEVVVSNDHIHQQSVIASPVKPYEPPFAPPSQPPPSQPVSPPMRRLPENPQLAVIGMGSDRSLAAALEQEFERRLSGHQVVDEYGVPEVDELLAREDVTPKSLGAELLKAGFHVLVLLRVEAGEQRKVDFGGQSLSAKGARLRLTAYLLPANRNLGPGWTELVEYTELSASSKARQAFIGATADLRRAIDDEWSRLRAASSPGGAMEATR